MSTPTNNVLFTIKDIGAVTYGGVNSALTTKCYTMVGRTTTDAFTNKTITDPSNTVIASQIASAGGGVAISGACAAGKSVVGTGSNTAQWQTVGSSEPLPYYTQIVYVNAGGNDTTGNGTETSPYATITYAMSTITDALWEKRYVIMLGPGNWADSFAWKAWVTIIGGDATSTRLTGTITINDPSWAVPGTHSDERASAQDLAFTGTITLDYTAPASPYGKFYFYNCTVNNTVVVTAQSPVNQMSAFGGFWFGGVTVVGGNVSIVGAVNEGGAYAINSCSTTGQLALVGGVNYGNLAAAYTTGVGVTLSVYDCPQLGTVSVSGAQATLAATNSSMPTNANVSVSGGATLTLLTDCYSTSYTPGNSANWATQPTKLQSALDRMASLLASLHGAPIP
jgi:hypothetical protein